MTEYVYCEKCKDDTLHTLGHADSETTILHCDVCGESAFYGRER